MAGHRPCNPKHILAAIDELERTAIDNPQEVVAHLQSIVPEYRSEQNEGLRPRIVAA